jgi:hypothetical protein
VTSDLRNEDTQEAHDERRHLDVDVDYGKVPRSHHTLADSLVQFSHQLAESDLKPTDSQNPSPVEARAPIPLGTDYENHAALEVAQETAPDDQVTHFVFKFFLRHDFLLRCDSRTTGRSICWTFLW